MDNNCIFASSFCISLWQPLAFIWGWWEKEWHVWCGTTLLSLCVIKVHIFCWHVICAVVQPYQSTRLYGHDVNRTLFMFVCLIIVHHALVINTSHSCKPWPILFLVLLHTHISICILHKSILISLVHISAFRTCHVKNAVAIFVLQLIIYSRMQLKFVIFRSRLKAWIGIWNVATLILPSGLTFSCQMQVKTYLTFKKHSVALKHIYSVSWFCCEAYK